MQLSLVRLRNKEKISLAKNPTLFTTRDTINRTVKYATTREGIYNTPEHFAEDHIQRCPLTRALSGLKSQTAEPTSVRSVCQKRPESPCRRSHWGLRWSSLWGHETCEGCARRGPNHHADAATGAFGGAPYGATERVRGAPKWGGGGMRALPLGPSVELPMVSRNV